MISYYTECENVDNFKHVLKRFAQNNWKYPSLTCIYKLTENSLSIPCLPWKRHRLVLRYYTIEKRTAKDFTNWIHHHSDRHRQLIWILDWWICEDDVQHGIDVWYKTSAMIHLHQLLMQRFHQLRGKRVFLSKNSYVITLCLESCER